MSIMESILLENTTLMFRILLLIFNIELVIVAVLGNALVCISIMRNSKIYKATNYYFLNISLCNLILLSFVIYPDLFIDNLTLLDNDYDDKNPEYDSKLFVKLMIRHLYKMIATTVVLTLVAISIDWYIPAFVIENGNLKTRIEFKKIYITIFGIWIISTLSIIPGIYEYEMAKIVGFYSESTKLFDSVSFTSIYNMMHSAVFFFLSIITILILCFIKICKNYNDVNSYMILDSLSVQDIKARKEKKFKFKILATVVMLYFIFWLPTFISNNEYYWGMLCHTKEALTDHRITNVRKIITLRIFLLSTVIVPFMWSKIEAVNEYLRSSSYSINLKMSSKKSFRLNPYKIKNSDVYESIHSAGKQ